MGLREVWEKQRQWGRGWQQQIAAAILKKKINVLPRL